jgi:hypothetical protein
VGFRGTRHARADTGWVTKATRSRERDWRPVTEERRTDRGTRRKLDGRVNVAVVARGCPVEVGSVQGAGQRGVTSSRLEPDRATGSTRRPVGDGESRCSGTIAGGVHSSAGRCHQRKLVIKAHQWRTVVKGKVLAGCNGARAGSAILEHIDPSITISRARADQKKDQGENCFHCQREVLVSTQPSQ